MIAWGQVAAVRTRNWAQACQGANLVLCSFAAKEHMVLCLVWSTRQHIITTFDVGPKGPGHP